MYLQTHCRALFLSYKTYMKTKEHAEGEGFSEQVGKRAK